VVEWHDVVWFSDAIPRHAFFLWLAFKDAIVTREHMCRWGYSGDSLCLFCRASQENRDHLFFECSLSRSIWRSLMSNCGMNSSPLNWNSNVHWSLQNMKWKNLQTTVRKLCFASATYNLWLYRNALLHGRSPKSERRNSIQY
jgi:hypothetical protein